MIVNYRIPLCRSPADICKRAASSKVEDPYYSELRNLWETAMFPVDEQAHD